MSPEVLRPVRKISAWAKGGNLVQRTRRVVFACLFTGVVVAMLLLGDHLLPHPMPVVLGLRYPPVVYERTEFGIDLWQPDGSPRWAVYDEWSVGTVTLRRLKRIE